MKRQIKPYTVQEKAELLKSVVGRLYKADNNIFVGMVMPTYIF